jgi:hypothetical protein
MPTGKVKINGVWYTIGGMSQVDKQTIDQQMSDNLSAAKAYADGLDATTNLIVATMRSDLSNAQTSMDGYFTDNIVYDSEMAQLNKWLTTLSLDKTNLDKRYDVIYNNQYLADSGSSTPKTDLYNSKADFDSKYTSLISTINTVIVDTKVDLVEKSQVDTAYTNINQSLDALDLDFQTAIDALANVYTQQANLGTPIAGLIGSLSDTVERHTSTITQTATQITQKVDSVTYNNQKTMDTWYNFVKSNNPNMIGDLESIVPPSPYSWSLGTLPDGTQGRVLDKKHTGGNLIDNTQWIMPEVQVDPKKAYLIETWIYYFDANSASYFGRDEYTGVTSNGTVSLGSINDDGSAFTVDNVVATSDMVGKWVKHYSVIAPYDAGSDNSHLTTQSSYTPDYDYKFWNENTAFIKPKIYLTYNVNNPALDSEMYAWGLGLYEIGSKINLYKEIENLNQNMTSVQSSITQQANEITLRVTTTQYSSDMQYMNQQINDTKNQLNTVAQQVPFYLQILSSNGSVFKNGQVSTTLTAKVYNGTSDVTDTIDASKFTWTRISSDSSGDASWNSAHSSGTKSITITPSDVNIRAVFQCEITGIVSIALYDTMMSNDTISKS